MSTFDPIPADLVQDRSPGQPDPHKIAAGRTSPHKIRKFLSLVMIEHSVFALPFAYIAALTAMWRETRSVHWVQLVLITVAMVAARTVAMSANRILDRDFDARNPRTAHRELVTGELSVRPAWTGTVLALVVFLGAAGLLSWLCLVLAPVAVALLVLYSYGKRFTDFPQALLALAQFVAPVGAWLAVDGTVSLGGGRARARGRDLDRRIRPDLLVPGRRRSTGGSARVRSRRASVSQPRCACSSVVHRGHAGGVRMVRGRRRSRLAVVARRRAYRRRAGLRARDRARATTCPASTGRSSLPMASSASACSASRSPT